MNKNSAFDSLENVRKRLLDLSNRNALLNYKHPKASSIRLTDVSLNNIYELLQKGKSLIFVPVPEPTQKELITIGVVNPTPEEWAKHLGISTSYDLPESQEAAKNRDNALQTILYAPSLEAKLRNLSNKSKTATEETGSHILYLTIGFLEWFESKNSGLKRFAPLFTLPVKLEKTGNNYSITLKDEALLSNTTLREKLADDFGLSLPTIDDDMIPGDYFKLVEDTILKQKPQWAIRRQVSLILLNFTKQAMYQDLNPSNWPDGKDNILNHPLIKKFFDTDTTNSASEYLPYQSEHSIDDIENIHEKFPLIYDADSSQHSALIDAINGNNLVIEGPPGSGKSQTITNLIAASIANGQRVLFLAEKMVALEVVKRYLDQAGFGEFCLELHSHKTNKQKILQDLNEQINGRQNSRIENIEDDILRYEDLKSKLRCYVDIIHTTWGQTGLTIHQILSKVIRYREQYQITPEQLKIEGIDGEILTPIKRKEFFDHADMLAIIFKKISEQAKDGEIINHYWYGVNNTGLDEYQCSDLLKSLRQWTINLKNLSDYWHQQIDSQGFNSADVSLASIQTFAKTLALLPELSDNKLLLELNSVVGFHKEFKSWLDKYEEIHNEINEVSSIIRLESSVEWDTTAKIIGKFLVQASKLGITFTTPLESLGKDVIELDRLIRLANSFSEQINAIRPGLPIDLHKAFTLTIEGLTELQTLFVLMQKLPTEFWQYRSSLFDTPSLTDPLEKLLLLLNNIRPVHRSIKDVFDLNNLPTSNELKKYQAILTNAGLFKWFSSEWRATRKIVKGLSTYRKLDEKLLNIFPRLIEYVQGIESITALKKDYPILDNFYDGMETPITRIIILHKWYQEVRKNYGWFGERASMAIALFDLNQDLALAIISATKHNLQKDAQDLFDSLKFFQKSYPLYSSLKDNQLNLGDSVSPFNTLRAQLQTLLNPLIKVIISGKQTLTLNQLNTTQQTIRSLHDKIEKWQEEKFIQLPSSQRLSILVGEFSVQSLTVSRNLATIADIVANSPVLLHLLVSEPTDIYYNGLKSKLPQLSMLIDEVSTQHDLFVGQGKVNMAEWTISAGIGIQSLITRNQTAIDNPKWLNTWLDYIKLKEKLSKFGLRNIIKQLEMAKISIGNLSEIMQLVLYHQLSLEIWSKNPYLAEFSGMEQEAIRIKYQEYDRKLLELQRKRIAYQASRQELVPGITTGKVSQYTEIALIRHEVGKKQKHIALRRLLKRASKTIQALKPCFMMSPMSVAQYLQPGQFHFDLVVMDEASQIRPEDALGAIARGQHLVVVGDPKQLPPTSFFNKILNDEDNEDSTALEETGSILDAVIPLFKTRRLRWHYRSRHQSLIAFSNSRFYGSDLVLFPSPFENSKEFGINFLRMEGTFENRRNLKEAEEVVKLAVKYLINNSNESVGIVAMNAEQRDQIEMQMEQVIKNDPIAYSSYEKNQNTEMPLFIKNLENVQGDERDIIIISMTYGPEKVGGRVMQRFGPINSDAGWRRLNVLFTRSRKRMYIRSSMSSGDIIVNTNSSEGVKSLKAFLEYCETGHLNSPKYTGKIPDSDFEVAVIRALEEYGYNCEPQLGVAGYYLDIAVRDPNQPGRFLMGIECDGATYHSAKSTRDRDRLRQEILEGLGWRIRRIWSTDWFKHPQAQLQPILQELEKLKKTICS